MSLYSIGHSNLSAEKFVALLKAHEIRLLADVRTKPASRWCPHFNRGNLVATLPQNGVAYCWYPVLGGLDNISVDSAEFVEALDELIVAAEKHNVVLMCSERDPASCHRASKLGVWLASARGLSLSHILPNAVLTQAQVVGAGSKRPP